MSATPVPRSAVIFVVATVLLLAVVKLAVAGGIGLSFDEGYYAFWSQRLAIGYLDHPPMVAWLIAAGRAVLGDDPLGVRVFAVLCGLLTTGLVYRIGMLVLEPGTALLAALLYAATPAAGLGFLMTPDPPSALFWAAALWAVAEWQRRGGGRWWLLSGIFAGLGLCSKYTDAFLAPGLLLFLLTGRERRKALAGWPVWAGSALALVAFAPVMIWNARHGWASFAFQGRRTVTSGLAPGWSGNLLDLVAGQMLYEVPILVLLAAAGLVLFLRRPGDAGRSGLALPVWTSLPALLYFAFHALHAHVEANWLIPLWPGLSLVAAAALMALFKWNRWVASSLLAVQLALGVALPGLVYAQALWQPFWAPNIDRTLETRGWPQLQAQLSGLARANGARWLATSHNYGLTGQLATAFLFAHDPLPVRQIDEPLRWLFLPTDPAALGWPALFVRIGLDAAVPGDLFGTAKLVGTLSRDGGRAPLETLSVFLVNEPTAKFWAGLTEK